jgi:hypothetical protein
VFGGFLPAHPFFRAVALDPTYADNALSFQVTRTGAQQ